MQDDERCCGTGTCIIDAAGRCWCGQQWDGERMCMPANSTEPADVARSSTAKPSAQSTADQPDTP